jgi:hypothetical protein
MTRFGYDMYAHNRATRRYGGRTWAEYTTPTQTTCPVCMATVTYHDSRFAQHVERCGFTICPASGYPLDTARTIAASMTDDFKLATEGALYD